MATHHIKVSGKVQGVFYRATAKKVAIASGLVGWVRNTEDDMVEIMVTGNEAGLRAFEAWCQVGPPQAEVEEVAINPVSEVAFEDFRILR